MARSTHIYIAYNHAHELLGAFTVKHELVTYGKRAIGLRGAAWAMHPDYQVAHVIRVPDGSAAGQERHKALDITDEILKSIQS